MVQVSGAEDHIEELDDLVELGNSDDIQACRPQPFKSILCKLQVVENPGFHFEKT